MISNNILSQVNELSFLKNKNLVMYYAVQNLRYEVPKEEHTLRDFILKCIIALLVFLQCQLAFNQAYSAGSFQWDWRITIQNQIDIKYGT